MAARKTTKKRAAPAAARRRPITPEDLLCLVGVGDTQMSPDGRSVLFQRKVVSARNSYETSVWVADAEAKRAPRAITKGPKDALARWSPDGTKVAFIRNDAVLAPRIMIVASKGGTARELVAMPHGTVRDLAWSPCGRRLAFGFRPTAYEWTAEAKKERDEHGLSTPPRIVEDACYRLDGDGYFCSERFALHVLDLDRGTIEEVFADTLGLYSWDWAPDGSALVVAGNIDPRASWNPSESELFLVNLGAGGKHRTSRITGIPKGPKSQPRWSPDGVRIAWAGRTGTDSMYGTANVELFVHDCAARTTTCLTAKTDLCLMASTLSDAGEPAFEPQIRWFPDSTAIFFRAGWHGSGRIASISAHGGPVAFHTEPGAEFSLGTFSSDGWRLSCVRSAPIEPGEVHVLEVERSIFAMQRVTTFNDALAASVELVEPQERWITAKDGHKVHCWTMRPRGVKGRLPALLEVHGGPHAQYGLTFFHEFQLLCAQGYEVWFSNPRGSKGYGVKHTAAIRGAWGTKDWTDVQAVAAAMRADRGIDRARIGIMGGSYGGYMANWAVAHDHGFRAAISDRCVSNLVSQAGNSDHPEVPNRYWKGAAFDRPEALWRASPIAHFKNVRTPMLLIHSEGDLRCNIEQSEQIHTALCTLGVPVRFVRYPRETSHGLSRMGPPDLRIHRLHEIISWWKHWMA
jgi:dipeptidyl aminopeptidase/acylaminoacyl peptidase